MPSPNNLAIIAAAGSRKTEHVIESALAVADGRVLITTYTNENLRQIVRRTEQKVGLLPPNMVVAGWFTFLLADGARPYQAALTNATGFIAGLDFVGEHHKFAKRNSLAYYFDNHRSLFRNGVSDFVCRVNEATDGLVIKRIESIYSHIFIDEVQDLVGYDLDFLDLLFASSVRVTAVGDPRQHTIATNITMKNKKYKKAGQKAWFEERSEICEIEERVENYRCNQAICDLADSLFPALPKTISKNEAETGHDGVFTVKVDEVHDYYAEHRPVVLRHSKVTDTLGLPAINIGVSKGSTYNRVLLFPTKPMLQFIKDGDPSKLKDPERLYVAVTRARASVAVVVP